MESQPYYTDPFINSNRKIITVNNRNYSEEELIKIINYYESQHPYVSPQDLFNQDMLYNIMLNSDIQDINQMCQLNIIANNICNSKMFWKEKLSIDYPLIKPNSTDWKEEYIL